MSTGRADSAMGLDVSCVPPPTPLHKHAVALARKIDRTYDGYVVDLSRLTDDDLARLAEAIGVRVEVAR